jgi:hypothetical protein
MMLGYTDNHAKDVYRMLNLETNRILLTRDIIWLKKMYGAWKTSDADNTSDDESINNLELQATNAGRESDDLYPLTTQRRVLMTAMTINTHNEETWRLV